MKMNRMKNDWDRGGGSLEIVVREGLSEEVIVDLRQKEWKDQLSHRAGGKILLAERTAGKKAQKLEGVAVFEMARVDDAC